MEGGIVSIDVNHPFIVFLMPRFVPFIFTAIKHQRGQGAKLGVTDERFGADPSSVASWIFRGTIPTNLNPNVGKVGGLQSQGAKGAAVVNLLQALGNAGSGALRLS
jgi:hypothetical protein